MIPVIAIGLRRILFSAVGILLGFSKSLAMVGEG